ncbi:MAG TPA: ACT domain-containing protein [Xanthobacteraceae bacterium]|nr:ACT domain-containing protein [Xanthobacteraceae bacterium]
MSEETYVFCTIPAHCSVPASVTPLLTFHEQEGTSLIMTLADAKAANLNYQYPSRMITLNAYSALDAVGFLAAITARLAAAGISANAVSAYHHDHPVRARCTRGGGYSAFTNRPSLLTRLFPLHSGYTRQHRRLLDPAKSTIDTCE